MTAPQLPADRPWLQRKVLRLYLRFWHRVDRMVDRAASRLSRWIFLHRSNMEYRFGPDDTLAERKAAWADFERRVFGADAIDPMGRQIAPVPSDKEGEP